MFHTVCNFKIDTAKINGMKQITAKKEYAKSTHFIGVLFAYSTVCLVCMLFIRCLQMRTYKR